jgi:hypothetical protein
MTASSTLRNLLEEYAVPLRVWLAPGARAVAADVLIDTLGGLADIQTDPFSCSQHLQGPAVLVITASDLRKPDLSPLLGLAKLARPGRVVLIGGTSDRDVLMEAINTWRAYRVVDAHAPKAALVDAVRDAGEMLRMGVALDTAIDDLDLENAMLDAAIAQMRSHQAQALHSTRQSAVSTMAAGLANTFTQEQEVLQTLATATASHSMQPALLDALTGLQSLTQLLQTLASPAVNHGETTDTVTAIIRFSTTLAGMGTGAAIELQEEGGETACPVDTYALTHLLVWLLRKLRGVTAAHERLVVRCEQHPEMARITITDPGQAFSSKMWIQAKTGHLASSVSLIEGQGVRIAPMANKKSGCQIEIHIPTTKPSP